MYHRLWSDRRTIWNNWLSGNIIQKIYRIACTALAFGSSVYVNGYEISKTKIVEKLLEFALYSKKDKNRAINLLVELSQLKMGDYHFMKNNCRDFVARAMDIIFDNQKRYDVDLDDDYCNRSRPINNSQLPRVKDKDVEKVAAVGIGGAALVGLGILAGYGIYKAVKSIEKRRQNQ